VEGIEGVDREEDGQTISFNGATRTFIY